MPGHSRPASNLILTVKDRMDMEATNDDDEVLAVLWRHWESSLRRVGGWTSAVAFAESPNIIRNASHKVTGIRLKGFGLKGSIPSELGALSSLQKLSLFDNQLTSIPAELGTLSSLKVLSLSHNQLTSIPTELDALSSLQELYLGYNHLTSIPAELGALSSLRELHLDHNQLKSIPAELGTLSSLQKLYLCNNQLTSIPSELGTLSSLQWLHLSDNCLLEMPLFRSSVRIHVDHQRLPTQLNPTFESWLHPSTPPDFVLFFAHDDETPEEKVPVPVHLPLLTSRWKYMALLFDAGMAEIQAMQLDFSNVLSHRAGQCLMECFYGMPINVTRLRPQDGAALTEHAAELYLDHDPRLALLLKFCKAKCRRNVQVPSKIK